MGCRNFLLGSSRLALVTSRDRLFLVEIVAFITLGARATHEEAAYLLLRLSVWVVESTELVRAVRIEPT